MLTLGKGDFEKIHEKISKLHQEHTNKIEQFYIFLQDLEKLRANKFKEVLKTAYARLHEISYQLPYEVQQYFEHEILRINQIILNNLRCYADLQLQLNLKAENNNRLQMQSYEALRTKWRDIKKKDALIKLNEQQLIQADREALLLNTKDGKTASKLFLAKEHTMEAIWTKLSPLPITSEDVDTWSRNMQETVTGLDNCARKLINVYKIAIVQVFNGYFEELQQLTENMLEMGLVDTAEISVLSLDVCKPTIQYATRQYSSDLDSLETLWESIITNLQQKLQTTYIFLHNAAHLWDLHFERLREAKRIVLKDLQNVIQKNNKATQDQEINLNITLDILRQAPDEDKLEQALDEVNNILDTLKKAYNSHYEVEVKVVEKYGSLVDNETEVLLLELYLFLHAHPKDLEMDPTQQRKRESQQSEPTESQTWILPQQMKQCEYQVDAVRNWMFGLWEAIEKYVATCKEETTQQANSWTAEHIKKLAKRLEVKLAFHTSRYSRIKIDVYDIRLAELRYHLDRLQRHKEGAEKELEYIRNSSLALETEYMQLTEDYEKKISSINSKLKKSINLPTLKAYISNITNNAEICNKKLESFSEQQQRLCDIKLYKIQEATIKFSKEIRLFAEGGSFHPDEAKDLAKNLKSLEKTIKKKLNVIRKEIETQRKKTSQHVASIESKSLEPLTWSLEEFEFIEMINNEIRRLQADLRNEAYNIKLLQKKIEVTFKQMNFEKLINLGESENLDRFQNHFDGIVLMMLQVSDYLYQSFPVINANKKDLRKLTSETYGEENSFVNYAVLLFETFPIENESFASKICCNLYKSLEIIQNEAQVFNVYLFFINDN
ncbi:hypothetical protein ILUMI_16317 [Ignelater luminosus]|uniref:DUF4455 domain-containing protein n=1 Tax=Ignelater luminosus TaxID=2038154 RepID=A0A8K0CRH4_IGNLU|nr:hypothetical protein ILUMI_16317 [Ignelater luminosus]